MIKTEKLEDQFLARQRFFDIFASLTNPPKRFELPKYNLMTLTSKLLARTSSRSSWEPCVGVIVDDVFELDVVELIRELDFDRRE